MRPDQREALDRCKAADDQPITPKLEGTGELPLPIRARSPSSVYEATYLRERRLKEACRLLAETRKPLAEIAYDCGFSSQSRMTTVFRQALDTTPLAYRHRCWHSDQGQSANGRPRKLAPENEAACS
jgi:AraC-like DNA-binding protein